MLFENGLMLIIKTIYLNKRIKSAKLDSKISSERIKLGMIQRFPNVKINKAHFCKKHNIFMVGR